MARREEPPGWNSAPRPVTLGALTRRTRAPVAFDKVLRGRRSIRRYAPGDIPDAILREVLDLARHAPSSMGGEPCCFVVVRDLAARRRLATIKNAHCQPGKREAFPADFLASAPLVVAVCVERERANGRERENGILAAGYLLLAAEARGLGGVYLTAYQPHDPGLEREIRELLLLPPGVEPVALVPLGLPGEAPLPKELRALAEIAHDGTFGEALFYE